MCKLLTVSTYVHPTLHKIVSTDKWGTSWLSGITQACKNIDLVHLRLSDAAQNSLFDRKLMRNIVKVRFSAAKIQIRKQLLTHTCTKHINQAHLRVIVAAKRKIVPSENESRSSTYGSTKLRSAFRSKRNFRYPHIDKTYLLGQLTCIRCCTK